MVPSIGFALLFLSAGCAVFSLYATYFAWRQPEPQQNTWLDVAHRSTLTMWGSLTAACGLLIYLFLTDDFSVAYVYGHSATHQATPYKISALWAGQGGSLLLWAWMLTAYSALVAVRGRRDAVFLAPTAAAVTNSVAAFFILLVALAANPFALVIGEVPKEGVGLNPLLQNYWMQIHPPTLYAGYVGCTVPFAYAMAALLHRRYDASWLAVVRRWTLYPWIVLTLGIIMGGRWAYETLGWGGYWAWDPVENASLMPWLTATAFLHSLMIQARRGMLKHWNMVLVTLTFLLSIFGTFLTRSGVVSSVHSFAESNIGPYFLLYLAIALVVSFAVVIWRRDDLAAETEFESPLSREGAFLLNNWILLGAAFAVLWGTVYPSVAEAVTGETVSVGKPYFNSVMIPLGLILLALTGIGPLMAWRKMSVPRILFTLRLPLLLGVLAAPAFYLLSRWHTGAATAVCLGVFVATAIISEFVRGARARRSMTGEGVGESFVNLMLKNRQRYGGYIVHLGIVIIFAGFAGQAFDLVTEPIHLKKNDTMKIGEYTLQFQGLMTPPDLAKEKESEVVAQMALLREDTKASQAQKKPVYEPVRDLLGNAVVMHPGVTFYKSAGSADPEANAGQPPQQAGIPAIRSNPAHDLYLVLSEYDPSKNTASIKAYLNPLVWWVWFSCLFFVGGTALSLLPEPKSARVREAAPSAASRGNAAVANTAGASATAASAAVANASATVPQTAQAQAQKTGSAEEALT